MRNLLLPLSNLLYPMVTRSYTKLLNYVSFFFSASLVENFAPGASLPQTPGDDANNCKNSMQFAEDNLGVPSIITPAEMSNPNIPELAIMAYTVQFTKVST